MRTIQELANTLDGVDKQIADMEKSLAKLLDKVHSLRDQLQVASYGLRNTDTVLRNLREQKDETLAFIKMKVSNAYEEMEGPF